MSDILELVVDSTTKIFKDLCTKEIVDELDEGKWAGDLWDVLAESGLLSIGVSEDMGGSGGDYIDAFHLLRLAGKYAVPLPFAETLIVNWFLAEQGAKPTLEPVTFKLEKADVLELIEKDNEFVVTGQLSNVPWARHAKKVLTFARHSKKSVLVILPIDVKQIQLSLNHNLASEPMDTLVYQNYKVKKENVYPVQIDETAEKAKTVYALAKAVMMSGALEKILDLCVQYVQEREQFGRPLYKMQAIQQYLAQLAGEVVSAATITNKAIETFQNQENYENEVAGSKLSVNESVDIATKLAHQIHGAIGVTHEYALHQYTRRLWAWREEAGNESYWSEKLAQDVLQHADKELWELVTN